MRWIQIQGTDHPPLTETPKEENDATIEKNEWGMGEHEMKPFTKLVRIEIKFVE